MFFLIFITFQHDIVLILLGEILSWSLIGVKGLKNIIQLCHYIKHTDTIQV